MPGFAMGDDISAAAQVMNTLFGGRFTSWLNTELRIKRGLTYNTNSRFQQWRNAGIFSAASYTKNDKIGEMLDHHAGADRQGQKGGLRRRRRSRARAITSWGSSRRRWKTSGPRPAPISPSIFTAWASTTTTGCSSASAKSSKAQADAVAFKYLSEQDFVLVVVGKADEISAQLAPFGDFKVKKIDAADF